MKIALYAASESIFGSLTMCIFKLAPKSCNHKGCALEDMESSAATDIELARSSADTRKKANALTRSKL